MREELFGKVRYYAPKGKPSSPRSSGGTVDGSGDNGKYEGAAAKSDNATGATAANGGRGGDTGGGGRRGDGDYNPVESGDLDSYGQPLPYRSGSKSPR